MNTKICSKCKKELPATLEFFYKCKSCKGNLDTRCKKCKNELSKKWHKKNPIKSKDGQDKWRKTYGTPFYNRKNHLKKAYDMTLEDFDILYKKQNGKCKVCNINYPKSKLCVDHDHISNEIRGLLCQACNKGLGCFKDNIDLLEKAILYLDQ